MSKPTILLIDDNREFLQTCAEFLEMVGYQVRAAYTPEEGYRMLQEEQIHLAIVDLRLRNHSDKKDVSGLTLAKETDPAIPKIILTSFQRWEAVREALGTIDRELPPAVGFVAKKEGLEGLLQHVQHAFTKYVAINWDLAIDWMARDRISLVTLIAPELDPQLLSQRADELEDLFRRVFLQAHQIRLDRLLWQRNGRLALVVFAFAKDKVPESLIVVCGGKAQMKDEARRYRDYAPKSSRPVATLLSRAAETTHFAAQAYRALGSSLESVGSLRELYQAGPEKSFNTVLKALYEETLVDWSQDQPLLAEDQSLAGLYRARLELTPGHLEPAEFAGRVQAVIRQAPTLGLGIECAAERLRLSFGGQSFSYPDPTPFIYQDLLVGQSVLLINTPGTVSGDNILTDKNERAWLTDFAEAGLAPALWNFVALEAAIRFDWVETDKLQWLHDMEQCLVEGEFIKLDASDVEAPLRKSLRAIQSLRRLTVRTVGKDPLPYQMGILFQAARRLADFNPSARLMPSELARLTHALIASAMICRQLAQGQQPTDERESAGSVGLWIDDENYRVWIDGRHVQLTGQGYELLHYLYEHANQVRTRRDIVEEVFRQKYDETDESQTRRLNTAIRRLRERIESDPERPRYLRTEPGRGYRLIC